MKKSKSDSPLSLDEIASRVGGTVDGDGTVVISGLAPIDSAGPNELAFVANRKYVKFIESTGASALVLDTDTPCSRLPVIRHPRPYLAFALITDILFPPPRQIEPGVHPSAVVEDGAVIGDGAAIGPFCHIGIGASIGNNCQLVSSVVLGRNSGVGNNCLLHPGVRLLHDCRLGNNVILHAGVVVGSDGFGFAESDSGARKIQHRGFVDIGDDVEIGANTTIDRGVMGATSIGAGTKIDNLVQIAHNVQIGSHCLIAAQTGISGSTKVGNGVIMAGQVGTVGHIEIGDGAILAAKTGVHGSVEPGKTLFGYPGREIAVTKRIQASLTRLPELLKRVRALEKRLSGEES